jgi:hypothetical protein
MISPRRRAQLGLASAALVFVTSLSIIISGNHDRPKELSRAPVKLTPAQQSPVVLGDFSK